MRPDAYRVELYPAVGIVAPLQGTPAREVVTVNLRMSVPIKSFTLHQETCSNYHLSAFVNKLAF